MPITWSGGLASAGWVCPNRSGGFYIGKSEEAREYRAAAALHGSRRGREPSRGRGLAFYLTLYRACESSFWGISMSSARAFTLIDVLVTLAVVGVLLAIAAPSLVRARMTARTAACGVQVRQIGIVVWQSWPVAGWRTGPLILDLDAAALGELSPASIRCPSRRPTDTHSYKICIDPYKRPGLEALHAEPSATFKDVVWEPSPRHNVYKKGQSDIAVGWYFRVDNSLTLR